MLCLCMIINWMYLAWGLFLWTKPDFNSVCDQHFFLLFSNFLGYWILLTCIPLLVNFGAGAVVCFCASSCWVVFLFTCIRCHLTAVQKSSVSFMRLYMWRCLFPCCLQQIRPNTQALCVLGVIPQKITGYVPNCMCRSSAVFHVMVCAVALQQTG